MGNITRKDAMASERRPTVTWYGWVLFLSTESLLLFIVVIRTADYINFERERSKRKRDGDTMNPNPYDPLYIEYARSYNRSGKDQLEQDIKDFPGDVAIGFRFWLLDKATKEMMRTK